MIPKYEKPKTCLDMSGLAFGKTNRKQREKEKPKYSSLKSRPHTIPEKIKKEILETKGNLCFMGLCENCGGRSEATDIHHFPHKSQLGVDCVEHGWPANRICHDHYQTHPVEEQKLFKTIETAGYKVIWKIKAGINHG